MSDATQPAQLTPATDPAAPIDSTGDGGIALDPEAALALLWTYGVDVLAAIAILVLGWIVARVVGGTLRKTLDRREKLDQQVKVLAVKGTRFLILAFTLVAVLGKFGIQTASIIAVLGGLGLAVGLALQGSLSNVASGVMIMVLRPFTLGEVINVGDKFWIIDDIGLFATRAHQPDGVVVTIPNNQLWGNEIVNLSRTHEGQRRIDATFGIAYGDDIDQAFAVITGVLESDERYLAEPEPLIAVTGLGDSSVDILCRVWVKQDDWWPAKLDLTKLVKQAFDREGITIPFPQRDVHLFQQAEATA